MGILLSKPLHETQKRPCDDQLKQVHQKKRKIVSNQLQLVDINNDCLQKIFNCLSLEDLFNVAESHPQFSTAVRMVYSHRYRNKKVCLNFDSINVSGVMGIEVRMDVAAIFFQHFGSTLSSLFINFHSNHDIEIEKSLQDHCANSLIDLELVSCDTSNFSAITEPFEKVEKLTITKSTLNQKLSQLNLWFPCVTCLELINVNSLQPEGLAANLQQLKSLVIHNEKMTISLATVGGLLRANPQIESLIFYSDYDADYLHLISKYLPHLRDLELWSPDDRFLDYDDEMIRFESVDKFTLVAPYPRGEFVVNMPFVFTHLRELMLDGFNEFKGQLLEFIKKNPSVTQLNLIPCLNDWDDLTCDDLTSTVNSLPNLIALTFSANTFTKNDIIRFLMQNKNLQMVCMIFIDLPIWPDFPAAIGTKWTFAMYYAATEIDCHFFKFNRKNAVSSLQRVFIDYERD